ncbi:MAG: MFS transporter [Bacillus sp. (in: firmicutes)]
MKNQNSGVGIFSIISLASIPLIMTLGNSMLIPVLPEIEKKLDISATKASLIITCYSVASIFLIPIAGYLSDRFGRKKIILPSLFIVLIGGLISGLAAWKMDDAFMTIIIGRVLQGIGAAGAAPIVLPLVGDLFKNDEEASATLGIIETSNTFGKVLSPALGALLAAVVWFLPFFAISIFSLLSLIMVLFAVKSPPLSAPLPFKAFLKDTKKIFQKEGRWLNVLFLVGGFAMFILFSLQVFLSSDLETTYKLKGVKKGLILAIPLLFLCISSLMSSKVIKGNKDRMKKAIVFGLLLQAICLFLFRAEGSIVLLLIIISGNGVAIGIILPALDALITENIDKSQRGIITSFYSSARFIGVAVGPIVMSQLYGQNLTSAKWIASALTIIMIILVIQKIQVDGLEAPEE